MLVRRLMRSGRLPLALLLTLPLLAVSPAPEALTPAPTRLINPVGPLQDVTLQFVGQTADSDQITGITHAGDDRLFLTVRDGIIRIFANSQTRPQPFLDIRNLVDTDGEGGLLSTAFHPDYAQNGFFFVNYTDNRFNTIIARYRVLANDPNRADPASARILLTIPQPFTNHNGGQIQFGRDGYLYIGMGDGGSGGDPACRAQRDDTLLGKMLRIDVDQNVNSSPFHGIPGDNPFVGGDGVPDEIWARGLRNPWRFSFDRQTGDLWLSDVGQNAREEVNLQPASSRGGENYGWKVMEGTLCFGNDACPVGTPPCNSASLVIPVLEYGRNFGCSVIGGYVYRGSSIPQLRGTYLFGDLCSNLVWGARPQGSGFEVRQLQDPPSGSLDSLVTFGEDRQGEVYLASNGNQIYRFANTSRTEADGPGLFEPALSRFHLRGPGIIDPTVRAVRFGRPNSGWVPVTGDWNGDGIDTIGFYDPRMAIFRLKNSLTGGNADIVFNLGPRRNNWIPVAGDWDGDGRDGVGLWEPSTATFRLRNALSTGAFDLTFVFGRARSGERPLAGDWNSDGIDGIGIYDPQSGGFRLRNTLAAGNPELQLTGTAVRNGLPVAGDWNGDGTETPGVYDQRAAVFHLLGAPGNVSVPFGPRRNNWSPLAGRW